MSDQLGTPTPRTWDDVAALGKEVVTRGYTALESNFLFPGDPGVVYVASFGKGPNTTDVVSPIQILHPIEAAEFGNSFVVV